ncbi:alpha/beta fold hydrolase [Helicobacter sp.]|uniref:alpha/beta fold hydrolase n=1 Tax=Helicobacter sp. TaxID=218 RepID=UPI0025C5ADC9|nr:alpha/beta hydrolase [Helicobacter sp.]MCI5969380.1 alpha/beta hydrolase [Helicobacter sp.]MDY2585635.1 alpha/beta hydrolase [Helicobacter sp.]
MAQKILTYNNAEFNLSYTINNAQAGKKPLVILHGWGASKHLMQQAFKGTFKDFTHYYIDLPGFGNSKTPPFALKTYDYAEILRLMLESLHLDSTKISIIGHSFGGKVATLLNPKILILLSSAGIPTQKSFKVRAKIAFTKLLNQIAPPLSKNLKNLLRSKDVQNMDETMYQTFKNVVDEDFSNIFKNFQNPCFIFWGREDLATPLSSGERIHALILDSKFFPLDGDHFFFLKQAKEIEKIYQKYQGK